MRVLNQQINASGVSSHLKLNGPRRAFTGFVSPKPEKPGVTDILGCNNTAQRGALFAAANIKRSVQTMATRNVVVAADASDEAIELFCYTLDNVYRPGDQLHIVHVVPDAANIRRGGGFYYPQAYDSVDTDELGQQIWQQAEDFIQQAIVCLAKQKGVEVNVVLISETKHHHIGKAVCEAAEELNASPLVLASHDKSIFERMLLGSISKFCAANCKTPVLLIHPDHSRLTTV